MNNTVIDINESTIKNFIESKRPEDPEIRKQVDLGYSYTKQSIELFEVRPKWDNPEEVNNIPFVKIRFYKSKQLWSLYWMRASEKWELYEPFPTSTHLTKLIEVIEKDEHGCFFG